jgi:hypothetical protein
MQFVEFLQISDCRYLQETEIILAGTTKIGDVTIEGGAPAVVLADTAMEQQVVPPSERTRAFCDLRNHGTSQEKSWAPPKRQRKPGDRLRSVHFSDVMLFRTLAAGWSETQSVKAVGRRVLELRAFPKKMSCGLRLRVLAASSRRELLTKA